MKQLKLLLLSLLLPLTIFAQFPVAVNNAQTFTQLALQQRAKSFSQSGTNFTATPGTVTAGVQVSAGIGFNVPPGRRVILTNITVTSDGPGTVNVLITTDAAGSWASYLNINAPTMQGVIRLYASFGANGGTATLALPSGYVMMENSQLTLFYQSANTTARCISYVTSGLDVPNEPNLNAAFKIVVFGDSTAWGNNLGSDASGRVYLGSWQWSETFRDLARASGVDAQIFANMADDGRTITEGSYQNLTAFDKIKYDGGIVAFGMNDAASAKFTSKAKIQEAAKSFITERDKFNKGKPICFLGPNGSDDPDRTGSGRLDSVRSWIRQVAVNTTYASPSHKVYYLDASTIVTPAAVQATDTIYKSSERVAGQVRVHPSGIGSTRIGTSLFNYLKTAWFGL